MIIIKEDYKITKEKGKKKGKGKEKGTAQNRKALRVGGGLYGMEVDGTGR